MARFLETFNVIEGDGQWSAGAQPFDTLAAGFTVDTYDICNPDTPAALANTELGQDSSPFAIKAYMEAPARCAPAQMLAYAEAAMAGSAEYTITKALWFGANDTTTDIFLKDNDVTEVPRVGDYYAVLGSVLKAAYAKVPHINPVIHLGFQSAMALQLGLSNLGLPFVVAPAYPQDAVAVTGSVTVRLGSIELTKQVDPRNNKTQIEATRLAKIEFDPFMAVRAADSVTG